MGIPGKRKPVIVPGHAHLTGADVALFTNAMENATRYLEYGSGGSTIEAARKGVETISIETDSKFAATMTAKISPYNHRVVIHYADIGPTRRWGYPKPLLATPARRRRYLDYVYAPERFAQNGFFDLVLIDGRFRVACALYVIRRVLMGQEPCEICFDDFVLRHRYREVEQYCVPEYVGESIAIFRPLRYGLIRMPQDADIRAYSKLKHRF